jgi:hypothetical protein
VVGPAGRGRADHGKDARADGGADAERQEIDGSERPLELTVVGALGIRLDAIQVLCTQQRF